ncbi:MAG TPA: hypothetical protein ENF26_04585, partial [Methanomicrobia archaeon]|nr:hypothetical protein [Methanomicrobia archaeon]HEX59407.1 hypothetical protein [Methanomicrobia archaeon]
MRGEKGRRIIIVLIVAALISAILIAYLITSSREKGLSEVRVAVLYERVTDGIYYLNRSVDDV